MATNLQKFLLIEGATRLKLRYPGSDAILNQQVKTKNKKTFSLVWLNVCKLKLQTIPCPWGSFAYYVSSLRGKGGGLEMLTAADGGGRGGLGLADVSKNI